MEKKNLYFVFDKLPSIKDGGLMATYIRLAELLKDDYNIKILSVFNYDDENLFPSNEHVVINNKNIQLDFIHFFSNIKRLKTKSAWKNLVNGLIYFFSIGINRRRIKKVIKDNDLVVVSSPSAAIFMPKNVDFILEIHTDFRFFWGKNLTGRLQSSLMQKPKLILFRTRQI